MNEVVNILFYYHSERIGTVSACWTLLENHKHISSMVCPVPNVLVICDRSTNVVVIMSERHSIATVGLQACPTDWQVHISGTTSSAWCTEKTPKMTETFNSISLGQYLRETWCTRATDACSIDWQLTEKQCIACSVRNKQSDSLWRCRAAERSPGISTGEFSYIR
jgi:hypothetical protein